MPDEDNLLSQNAINELVSADAPQKDERREHERHRYAYAQRFTPLTDSDKIPELAMFRTVRCADLSEGGFAFLWPREPEFEFGVVALGVPPNVIKMKVKVVATMEKEDAFLVGCKFVSRC